MNLLRCFSQRHGLEVIELFEKSTVVKHDMIKVLFVGIGLWVRVKKRAFRLHRGCCRRTILSLMTEWQRLQIFNHARPVIVFSFVALIRWYLTHALLRLICRCSCSSPWRRRRGRRWKHGRCRGSSGRGWGGHVCDIVITGFGIREMEWRRGRGCAFWSWSGPAGNGRLGCRQSWGYGGGSGWRGGKGKRRRGWIRQRRGGGRRRRWRWGRGCCVFGAYGDIKGARAVHNREATARDATLAYSLQEHAGGP